MSNMQHRYQAEMVALLGRLHEMDAEDQECPSPADLLQQINTRLQNIEIEHRELGVDFRADRIEFLELAALAMKAAYFCIRPQEVGGKSPGRGRRR